MRITRVCECGKSFATSDYRISNGRGIYCSVPCRIKYSMHPKKHRGYVIKKNNPGWFCGGKKPWNFGVPERESTEESLQCEELWNINNGQTLCESCHDKKGR
jgi:hypothetical protein